MPISFTTITAGQKWHGSTWTVDDESELADMLACVAIGQAAVLEKILHETGCVSFPIAPGGIKGARNLLTVTTGKSPNHRDGWVFQVISWIAAHLQSEGSNQTSLIRPPQMIQAQKGQDGLIIEYSDDAIVRVVICEDKATKNPRQQVRDRVLPELRHYETGSRDHELIAGVTSLLASREVDEADAIATSILWDDQRKDQKAYRVALTVEQKHTTKQAQAGLFKGYDEAVSGDVARRRIELLPLNDLRPWLQNLADRALAALDKLDV